MCKCREDVPILKGNIEKFNDTCLFGMKQDDNLSIKTIQEAFEEEIVQVFIDRGFLRLAIGDDLGCLDHSVDLVKVNFCPMCGEEIQ